MEMEMEMEMETVMVVTLQRMLTTPHKLALCSWILVAASCSVDLTLSTLIHKKMDVSKVRLHPVYCY